MKRGIMTVCFLTLFTQMVMAQRGLYFNPVFRNGISTSEQTNMTAPPYEANIVYTYGAEFGIGYSIDRLRIQAGVGYQRSGYSYNITNSTTVTSTINHYFNHAIGTLQLGYVLRNNKRLAVVPYLGASYTINYGARNVSRLNDGGILKKKVNQNVFKNQYAQSSILANAKVHFEYRFAQNAAFIFGPSFQYMITDMAKKNLLLTGDTDLKNHVAFLDLGIIWILPDKSKSGKNRMPSLFYN